MSDEEKGYEPPAWLLTYGDMTTLLVTFFVMLISLSTINVDKYKKTMSEVQKSFVGRGGEFLLEDGTSPIENLFEKDLDTLESLEMEDPIEDSVNTEDTYNYLSNFIKESNLARYISIEDIKVGCRIEIPLNLCFEDGESVVKREAHTILEELGEVLRNIGGKIIIDTNVGMAIKRNAEETDLSIDRAASICDFLVTKEDVEPQRVAISGCSSAYGNGNNDTIGIIIVKK
jgi:flagellar motor protein MotB